MNGIEHGMTGRPEKSLVFNHFSEKRLEKSGKMW
jgi:hypothetical protein